MKFKKASALGSLVSKEYAEDFFRLLVKYRNISASEAASRLGLHIKTAQDFLDGLTALGVVSKEEVFEKKRPYFRYGLTGNRITIEVDLLELYDAGADIEKPQWLIREKKNSGAMFKTSGKNDIITSVNFFVGKGRSRDEKRISLTTDQGRFLFHLPFPTEGPATIESIIEKSGVDRSSIPELLDIVDVLMEFGVVERVAGPS